MFKDELKQYVATSGLVNMKSAGEGIPSAVLKAMADGIQLPGEDEFDEVWAAQ